MKLLSNRAILQKEKCFLKMYYHRGIKKEQSVIAVQSGFSQNIRLKNVPTIKVTYVTKTRELLGICPLAYWRF